MKRKKKKKKGRDTKDVTRMAKRGDEIELTLVRERKAFFSSFLLLDTYEKRRLKLLQRVFCGRGGGGREGEREG